MTVHLNSQADLDDAITALVKLDARLQPILEIAGMPALRRRAPGCEGLAQIIRGPQRPGASAPLHWGRGSGALRPLRRERPPQSCAPRRLPVPSA